MDPLTLNTSTGFSSSDALLRTLVNTFERAFPERVRGYYVIGSYAERTAVTLSDLDCFILFKHDFESQAEQHHARQVSQ